MHKTVTAPSKCSEAGCRLCAAPPALRLPARLPTTAAVPPARLQGLRLHDNPALLEAAAGADALCPLFILDPWFLQPDRWGGGGWGVC